MDEDDFQVTWAKMTLSCVKHRTGILHSLTQTSNRNYPMLDFYGSRQLKTLVGVLSLGSILTGLVQQLCSA